GEAVSADFVAFDHILAQRHGPACRVELGVALRLRSPFNRNRRDPFAGQVPINEPLDARLAALRAELLPIREHRDVFRRPGTRARIGRRLASDNLDVVLGRRTVIRTLSWSTRFRWPWLSPTFRFGRSGRGLGSCPFRLLRSWPDLARGRLDRLHVPGGARWAHYPRR